MTSSHAREIRLRFRFARSVAGRDFLELFEDIETLPKESVFHRNKFVIWNMEDLQPISDAEQAASCVELAKRLKRTQDHLCDITLMTQDDKEFKAHRDVLSSASPFFSKLLQSDMKENREGIVRFEEISGAVMEDVLEFIYTGSVEVTQGNSEDLIAAANYLLVTDLKTVSGRFLERQMSESNCISTFYFAEMYQCDELITNTRKFIHANFASVVEMNEFLNLEAKEVERWISSDKISVAVEADVFKIVLKWIEQDQSERRSSFEQLFGHVRLASLSRDFLFDVVTNELVRENFSCLKLISDAVKLTSFTYEGDLLQSPRKGLETRAIVARGGKYTFCYLPEKDEWKRLADGLSQRNYRTKMISYRDELYAFPLDGKGERYDPVVNGWCTLDLSTTSSTKVAVVRGEIYAIEVNTSMKKSTIKRYDIERCSWQTVLSCYEFCREGSCVVAAGNHLYVCGGRLGRNLLGWNHVSKAERFDTVENKREEIANMQQERGNAFDAATKGKIFVAGGEDWESVVETCEMFNMSTNEWQLIGSLNVPRACGSMLSLNGKLYVLGGTYYDWSEDREIELRIDVHQVECYDPTEDKWIKKTRIPVEMIPNSLWSYDIFNGCVVKLSKGVLDNLRVVKE